MANPFFATTPEPTKATPREVDPETTPRLKCKVCKTPVVRTALRSSDWVHEDDETVFNAHGIVSMGKYNHPAQPDYIEVTARDTP